MTRTHHTFLFCVSSHGRRECPKKGSHDAYGNHSPAGGVCWTHDIPMSFKKPLAREPWGVVTEAYVPCSSPTGSCVSSVLQSVTLCSEISRVAEDRPHCRLLWERSFRE